MLAKKYFSVIKSVSNPFEGIYTLEFSSLGKPYKFNPGQFLHLALDTAYDGIGQWPESRCFSMQSSPEEETIKITYAVKGDFTKKMEEMLRPGSEIWLKLPYGDLFTQSHNKTKTVFIAGGTGITPFLSLFTSEQFSAYKLSKVYLGFRSKAYHIFISELNRLNEKDVKVFYQDKDGIIDIHSIFAENGKETDYFISGPPMMIKSFKKTLIDLGVSQESILTDDWE